MPGLFKYTKETFPDAKTVGLTGWDIGEPNNSIIKADVLKKIADGGYEFNGLYELCPVGTQDFVAGAPEDQGQRARHPALRRLRPGSRVRSSTSRVTAGLKAKIIGFEFTPDGVNASKGTYDRVGWTFAYDYFDAEQPDRARWRSCSSTSSRRSTASDARLLRRQLLREHARDVGGHPPGAGKGRRHQRRRPARQGPARQPHGRQRLRRRRHHGRHLHARPDDPLGGQARRWACSSTRTGRSRRTPSSASAAPTFKADGRGEPSRDPAAFAVPI